MEQPSSNRFSQCKDLEHLGSLELLRIYADVLNTLKDKQILRTTNSPTGDYAELLAAKWLEKQGLAKNAEEALNKNSHKGSDVIDDEGTTYQVKGRRITASNPSKQLGVVRNLFEDEFHCLIAIVFNEDWSVKEAALVPIEALKAIPGSKKDYVNGHIFHLNEELLKASGVKLITDDIKGVQLSLK
ncbi:hypothetical protein ICN11_04115 [Polynucleobacter sp. 78F-HAINBA]|uniref:hypothetical protein n=1 Tax=Polynucleobacter sp. 78F-HAINBA TaxID=2689099 RepID=UPI001C0DC238|nr:hypothetical protein [Polynucleobacter sp. 78F-HAINBA]MBU3591201.1 hypothetical protein [Polynucleobacter sp. 78F-HAINBA]